MAYLKLGQDWDNLLLSHLPEGGPLQSKAALHHDATLPGYVAGRVHIVTGDHAHKDACPFAYCHRVWHLFAHRILQFIPLQSGTGQLGYTDSRHAIACLQH